MNTTLIIHSQECENIIRESWNHLTEWIFEAVGAIQALENNKKAPFLGVWYRISLIESGNQKRERAHIWVFSLIG